MTFWIVAAALTAVAVALLLRALLRAGAAPPRAAFDRAIYRDQLAELERDRARGLISPAEAEAACAEIARRLIAAADAPASAPPGGAAAATAPARPPRALALALAAAIPIAALAIYLPTGDPSLPSQPYAGRDHSERDAIRAAAAEADALEQRLTTTPDDLDAWVELGERRSSLGQFDAAVDAFGRAVGLSGGDPGLTGLYGQALVQAGDGTVTETAKAAFERALALDPGNVLARLYLPLARYQAGDDRGALEGWQALMRDSPADAPWVPMLRTQLAEMAEKLGLDPAEAIPEPASSQAAAIAALPPAEQAEAVRAMVDGLAARLASSPDDLDGWLRLARAREMLGEPAAAAAAYARAAALAPDEPEVLSLWAQSELAAGRAETVSPDLAAAMARLIAKEPDSPLALWFLGAAAAGQGDPAEARRHWTRLLDQFAPGSPEATALQTRIAALSS